MRAYLLIIKLCSLASVSHFSALKLVGKNSGSKRCISSFHCSAWTCLIRLVYFETRSLIVVVVVFFFHNSCLNSRALIG